MAKRRTKKRTHVAVPKGNPPTKNGAASMNRSPKTMVIRVGAAEVGASVSQLVKDVRQMMEPDTATRLKERKGNRLKDYTTMAGPLGVTHLFLFSKSSTGNTNLRLALTPRGPTLNFKIENYSLCRDVAKALKHPRRGGKLHLNPPLLVMNNFATSNADDEPDQIPKHLESLTTTIFQSLFPPISPQSTPLSSIRRIMLLNRELVPSSDTEKNNGTYTISLRHYAITTRKTGISKRVRRLDADEQRHQGKQKAIPNLGKLNDVSDYLLDPTAGDYTSASETEMDTDAEVEVTENVARKVLNKKEMQRMKNGEGEKKPSRGGAGTPGVEKRAVKLVELGPRMKLKLMKVEEGLCGGRVMWHHLVRKSNAEVRAMDETWERREKVKEARRKEQKANVERKKKEKEAAQAKSRQNGEEPAEDEDGDEDMDDLEDEWDSDDFDENDEVADDNDDDAGEVSDDEE